MRVMKYNISFINRHYHGADYFYRDVNYFYHDIDSFYHDVD